MNCVANRLVIWMLWLWAGTALLGCGSSKPTPPPEQAAVDPVAAFDRVVINLGHYLGQLRAETYYIENGAYFDIRHNSAVTKHELTPPADGKSDYQGLITVTTKYNISVRPPVEKSEDEGDKDSDSKNAQPNEAGFAAGEAEAENGGDPGDLQPMPVKTPPGLLPRPMEKSQAEEVARTYRLVFRNDLWELVEAPQNATAEPKEEEAAEFSTTTYAVKRALNQQHVDISRP